MGSVGLGTRTPATVNRELVALRRALSLAIEDGIIAVAPRVPHLRENNARQGFFQRGEIVSILDALPDEDLRDFVRWSYLTGMRPGESLSLTWQGFDRETWSLRLHEGDAKSGHGRAIMIEGSLRGILQRRIDARVFSSPLVFHRKGKRLSHIRPWRRACAAAGLAGRRFYDLRRTAIRNMVHAGVPEHTAMSISGHRTRSMFDRYSIVAEDDLRKAAISVSEFVERLPKSPTVAVFTPTATSKAHKMR